MSEGVLDVTVDTAKRHPWLIGGALVGLVLVLSLATRKSTTPANFQFSIGPTDTQLKTQAAIAIAQDANATQAGVYGQYFDYLASSGASNNSAAMSIAQINGDTQRFAINQNDAAAVAIAGQQYSSATQIAGYQSAATVQQAQINGSTQIQVAQLNDQAMMYHDQAATAASESHDFTSGVLATIYSQTPSANLAQILQAKAAGYLS